MIPVNRFMVLDGKLWLPFMREYCLVDYHEEVEGQFVNGRFPDWLLKRGLRSRKLFVNGHEVKRRGLGQFESNPFLGGRSLPAKLLDWCHRLRDGLCLRSPFFRKRRVAHCKKSRHRRTLIFVR
jgi:hypothetical protein